MSGRAVFLPLTNGYFSYREEGNLRLADGQSFDAHRTYIFEQASDGFRVYFDEAPPRLFHHLVLSRQQPDEWQGKAEHICAADRYDSHYHFLADESFTISHTVSGPRKNYISQTRFRRPS